MPENTSETTDSPVERYERALHALATALHRLTSSTEEHPQTAEAIENAHVESLAMLEAEEAVEIVVGDGELTVNGVALDSSLPAMIELPLRLHRRDIGTVRLERGLERDELAVLLRAVARREERTIDRSSAPPRQVSLPHAQLFPVRIEPVEEAVSSETPAAVEAVVPELAPEPRNEEELLWERMVTLAAASGSDESAGESPSTITERLQDRLRLDSERNACAADVLALLAHAAGGNASTRRRVVDTLSALTFADLELVVAGLPGDDERTLLVEHAARLLPAETTVAAARAAATVDAIPLSSASVLLLQKLAAVAEVPTARGRARAEAALRRHVEDIVASRREAGGPIQVRDPAPSLEPVLVDADWAPKGAPKPSWAARLTRMGAELNVDVPAVHAALEEVAEHEENTLVSLAKSTDTNTAVGARVRARAFTEDALETLLESAADEPSLGHVADALGPAAVPALVTAMLQPGPRSRSYRVARVLSRFGLESAREACSRLPGAPRMMQRSVLVYLRAIGEVPEELPLDRYARHPDHGVRAAAVRLQLTIPGAAAPAAHDALLSGDPHLVRLAVRYFARNIVPPDTVPLLLDVLRSDEQPDPIRALAVRGVQGKFENEVLEALLDVTATRGRLLRRPKLAPLSQHVVRALHVLARDWGGDERAREVLDLALELGALVPPKRTPSLTPRPTPVAMPIVPG